MSASEPTDTRSPGRQVVDNIVGEVMAQLDDLSDDTMSLVEDADLCLDGPTFALAEDLRQTLQATIDQRVCDWCADHRIACSCHPGSLAP